MKRTLAIIMTVMMLLSALPLCASAASADLLEYEINNGEVTITGYDSNSSYYSYGELIIPSEIEGYPVTSIGGSAFWGSDLSYISIPDGVTSIGWGAFSFSDIWELYIPASVTNIEFAITRGCWNLCSVVVDKNNPVYDSRENCNAIVETASNTIMLGCKSTTFPASITTIGNSAYSYSNTSGEIAIPGSIKKIEDYAFESSNLKKVIVEEGTVSIAPLAFWDCCDITTMYLPTSLTKGGFACNDDLYDIYYAGTKEQLEEIEEMTVGLGQPTIHCSADESILRVLDDSSFHEQAQSVICYELDENTGTVIISGLGEINSYKEDTSYSYRPYDTERNNSPFYNNETINQVVIEEGITSICKGLFDGCTNLKTITIPGYISNIDEYAFNNCQSLSDVYFGGTEEQWNEIKIDKFNDCLSNATIHFSPYNYEKCGKNVFWELNEETGVLTISGTGKMYDYDIGTSPFYKNDLIKEAIIKNGVTNIGERTFSNCNNLTSITIPDSITRIGEFAFSGCSSLTSVKIPDSITRIEEWTFSGCSSLTSIKIPDSVTSIGNYAFSDCSNLRSITIPDSITRIELSTFSGCSNLTSIIIPDSVSYIDWNAFFYCTSLTSIKIPDSVTSIGNSAFYCCSNLSDVYYGGTRAQWNEIKIGERNGSLLNATIHCIDDHVHTLSHIVTPASCVVKGMEYDICTECGEVLNSVTTPEKGHSWGEWVTVTEPTVDAEGLSQRECTVCKEKETQPIPKLNVAKDEKSGVEIIYSDEFEKGVEVTVSNVFDGQSLQLIEAKYPSSQTAIFDITTTQNGEKVQPDGKVTVRIPLPEGFGTENIFVCYVDSVNGNVTSLPTTVENGYVIFTAEHFSHYAVVEIVDKAVNSVKINDVEMKYKSTAKITPQITADDGVKYEVKFDSSNPNVATVDKNGNITTAGKGETTITCTVTDQYGNVAKDTCKVTVKFSFGQWLIWILLFGFLWY